jgi:hypothetical protein
MKALSIHLLAVRLHNPVTLHDKVSCHGLGRELLSRRKRSNGIAKMEARISLLKCREFSLGCSSRSPQLLRDVPQELACEGNYTRLTLSQAKHAGEQVFKGHFAWRVLKTRELVWRSTAGVWPYLLSVHISKIPSFEDHSHDPRLTKRVRHFDDERVRNASNKGKETSNGVRGMLVRVLK